VKPFAPLTNVALILLGYVLDHIRDLALAVLIVGTVAIGVGFFYDVALPLARQLAAR